MWHRASFEKYSNVSRLNNDDTCMTTRRSNTTAISYVYEGIPETLLLNVVTWILLILLFAILRNRAWDYGRLALVHTEKWTQLFYRNIDEADVVEESGVDVSLIPDTGCLWFPAIFKISRDRIYARCGPDASHYLSFQRQLLILFSCITMFSLCVILPINFQGKLQGSKTTFGHTTISNLDPTSSYLWVHVAACFLFVPLTILIMRKSSGRIPSATPLSSCTLMVTHISHSHRNTEDIKNYMNIRYPGVQVLNVQMAYPVKKLMSLERKRVLAYEAKMYCNMNHTRDLKVQPLGCIVCCPWKTIPALSYYEEEERMLAAMVIAERKRALDNPLGIAFVTVNSEETARYIIQSFVPGTLRHWLITKAPTPSDINWENLEISYRNWYSKAILINSVLFVILFFLTTPVIIVQFFNLTSVNENFISKISPVLSDFVPTLVLLSLSAVLPVLVSWSDELMSHWTKSKQNHATMHKTFFFLLFMVLILPSLGLTSAQAFVQASLESKNITLGWECIFLADKGAFFVNYVITSALIGTALELLRFPELAMYAFRLMRIKSEAEKTSVRKEIMVEFPFGIHYAWTLLIFTTSTAYSLTCPLITPFGLLYLGLKHFVDKYNIYYVYRPITMCGEGQQIHSDSVKMVRVAILLMQVIMAAFSFIRGGLNVMSSITFLGAAVTACFFFFLSPFPSCKPVSVNVSNFPTVNEQYIAPVLTSSELKESDDDVTPTSYGSSDINVIVLPDVAAGVSVA